MKLVTPIVLFSSILLLVACGSGEGTGNSSLEKEKLELEKKKLELEEAKFKADQEKKGNSKDESTEDNKKASKIKSEYRYLIGKWKGSLGNKNLTIVIEEIDGNTVKGYNITGSNKRGLTGRIYPDDSNGLYDGQFSNDKIFKLVLSEPGDDKWDGVFNAYFYTGIGEGDGRFYIAQGKWGANNGKRNHEFTIYKD